MPFDGKFDFVLEAIKEATLRSKAEHGVSVTITRADEQVQTKRNKIEEIKIRISMSDFCLIDFSELRPNVMWEFGFCQCLRKHVVAITHTDEPIPFNLQGTDHHRYHFSSDGLAKLSDGLVNSFRFVRDELASEKSLMISDPDISSRMENIYQHLGQVRNSSLTRDLVFYEVERLARRVRNLRHGTFDLRTAKPIAEVIQVYCDYMEQLDSNACTFRTVTCSDFWRAITMEGKNDDYVQANRVAVQNGASIKRVFALDPEIVIQYNQQYDMLIKRVLLSHLEIMEDLGKERFGVKIISVPQWERKAYKNQGILTKANEKLLFKPVYNDEDELVRTDFIYNLGKKDQQDILRAERQFSRAFSTGDWLAKSLIEKIC
jgi:hypothetical protein